MNYLARVAWLCIGIASGVVLMIFMRWHFCGWSFERVCRVPHAAEPSKITHVGVIMDGNRRWARQHGLEPWMGHKQGIEPLRELVKLCLERHIPYLTVYAFSLENFKRSADELHYLFDILAQDVVQSVFNELITQEIRIRFVGDRTKFPEQLREMIDRVEKESAAGKKLTVHMLFCYGGQQEILAAVRTLATQVEQGSLRAQDIDAERFQEALWLGAVPAPDLVIRTGGDERMSNFLTYQIAYAEIRCVKTLWPDMTRAQFEQILNDFGHARRNFGA